MKRRPPLDARKLLATDEQTLRGYSNVCTRLLTCSREYMGLWGEYRLSMNKEGFLLDWGKNARPSSKTCKLMIVIPIYKRDVHLRTLLNCLQNQKAKLSNPEEVLITVSEMDETSNHRETATKFGALYNYTPTCFTYRDRRINIGFNKSFAMNSALWHNWNVIPQNVLFHDVDIVMGEGWLDSVLKQIDTLRQEKGSSWFCQTIKDRKVEYVDKGTTNKVFSGLATVEDLNDGDHTISEYWPERPPPGGSVMVPMELFVLSGGFDEFLFKGYSPEDSQFLQACLRLIDPMNGGKVDVLQTEARSFHLYHPTSEFSNDDLSLLHFHHDTLNDECFKYGFYIHTFYKHHDSRIVEQWAEAVRDVIPSIPDFKIMCHHQRGEDAGDALSRLATQNIDAAAFIAVVWLIQQYDGYQELFLRQNNYEVG